jgi:hypothetical protein
MHPRIRRWLACGSALTMVLIVANAAAGQDRLPPPVPGILGVAPAAGPALAYPRTPAPAALPSSFLASAASAPSSPAKLAGTTSNPFVETVGSAQCCGECGRKARCEKYCEVVCETREVKKVVWEVKCEEFAPLLPAVALGCRCEHDGSCDGCAECNHGRCAANDPCAGKAHKRVEPPECGHVRCRKILVKKEVVCKVPVYKSVIVYCCAGCGVDCAAAPGAPGAIPPPRPVPPPPAPAGSEKNAPAPLPKSPRPDEKLPPPRPLEIPVLEEGARLRTPESRNGEVAPMPPVTRTSFQL